MLALLAACAHGPSVPAVDPSLPPSSAWMVRAIDPTKDIVITADLRALFADDAFAPAARRAMRAASDRSVPSANLKDAWDGARGAEVVLLENGTILLLLTEVPDLDPTSLTGWDGTWQWKKAASGPPPGTLEHAFIPEAGSLFVLADRTWILGAGVSAQRARSALLETRGHPVAKIDLTRPLSISVPASRMIHVMKRVRVRELGPALDGVRMLRASSTVGAGATLTVELEYDGDASAARGATVLAEAMRALATREGEPLAFLGAGRLVREGNRLRLDAPLSASVLEWLAHAEDRLF